MPGMSHAASAWNSGRARSGVAWLVVLGLITSVAVWGVRGLGRWLVVSDPLRTARAIVVLCGAPPFRAMEAAKIYREGWAPEVWVTHAERASQEAVFERLGIKPAGEDALSVEVLEKMGVPGRAIRVLPQPVANTEQEERVVTEELKRVGGGSIIIVTSPPHTRRARAIWHALHGDNPPVMVRGSTDEPYDANHWWRNTDDASAVSHEVLGLLNAWSGFPARARR